MRALLEELDSFCFPDPKTFLVDGVITAKTGHLHKFVVAVIDAMFCIRIALFEFAITNINDEIALLGEWRGSFEP